MKTFFMLLILASVAVVGRSLPDPETEPTVTVQRAGEVLGISRNAAYDAVAAGQIPSLRIGARIVIPTALLLKKLGLGPLANAEEQAS